MGSWLSSSVEPLLVSPAQAARLLGLGRTKVFELLASGRLASKREGARRLVSMASVQAYAACEAGRAEAG